MKEFDGHQDLAHAIVKQACIDYVSAKKALTKNPKNYKAKKDLEECREFLTSDWCEAISGLSGEYLLEMLEERKL